MNSVTSMLFNYDSGKHPDVSVREFRGSYNIHFVIETLTNIESASGVDCTPFIPV